MRSGYSSLTVHRRTCTSSVSSVQLDIRTRRPSPCRYFILWLRDYSARYTTWARQWREQSHSRGASTQARAYRTLSTPHPPPNPALALFYLRAKETFLSPDGPYALRLPQDVLSPFQSSSLGVGVGGPSRRQLAPCVCITSLRFTVRLPSSTARSCRLRRGRRPRPCESLRESGPLRGRDVPQCRDAARILWVCGRDGDRSHGKVCALFPPSGACVCITSTVFFPESVAFRLSRPDHSIPFRQASYL